MQLACLMMQKNEAILLKPWLDYHAMIFGLENIFIYDNGSTDKSCIDLLEFYEKKGLNVEWNFKTKNDFEKKGKIFADKIKQLDESDLAYDFYFPLDCDEFIAYERAPGDLLVDKKSIELELKNYIGCQFTLSINAGYDNNPLFNEFYFRSDEQRKSFFYKGTCLTLDMGFHSGKTSLGVESKKTKIVYVHHHYKEFHNYQASAKEKLLGRVVDFSTPSLQMHRDNKGPGYHLIGALLTTEEEYYNSFHKTFTSRPKKYHHLAFVSAFIKGLGLNISAPEHLRVKCSLSNSIRGVIDSVKIVNNHLTLKGWAVPNNNDDIYSILIFSYNDDYFELSRVNKYHRPDVVRSVNGANLNCGVIAEKELSSKELAIIQSGNIKIIIKNKTLTSKLSFNCKNISIAQ